MMDLTLEELTAILTALPVESAVPEIATARAKIRKEIKVRLEFFREGAENYGN